MNRITQAENIDVSSAIAKPMLSAVLFQDEINAFLKEQFYESWMDEEDWIYLLSCIEESTGITVESLCEDLKVGLENGHSIEKQLDLFKLKY